MERIKTHGHSIALLDQEFNLVIIYIFFFVSFKVLGQFLLGIVRKLPGSEMKNSCLINGF